MLLIQIAQLLVMCVKPGIFWKSVVSLGGRFENKTELLKFANDSTSCSGLINKVLLHPVDDIWEGKRKEIMLDTVPCCSGLINVFE